MAKKQAEKKPAVKKPVVTKERVVLDPSATYNFVVTKASRHMKVGTYKVDGVMAQLLMDKGYGIAEA